MTAPKWLRRLRTWLRGSTCPDGTPHPAYVYWLDGTLHCIRCKAKL